MKILVLSDILWEHTELSDLQNLVNKNKPELVLLTGDLVDDKSGTEHRKKYWGKLKEFFVFLDSSKIQTFFVEGNWDYDIPKGLVNFIDKKLKYVKNISEKVEVFRGIKLMGIPYSFTRDLRETKYLVELFKDAHLDIILAHAENKRRIWLFHLNTNLLITGHYDKQLFQIKNKVFISLQNYPFQYVVINYNPTKYSISYFDKDFSSKGVFRQAVFSNKKLIWKSNPFKGNKPEANTIKILMKAREEIEMDKSKKKYIISDLVKKKIPRTHIEEYLQIDMRHFK